MRKDTMLVVLGVVITLLPFAGIPAAWKTALTALLGIGVAFIALSLRHYLTRVSQRLSQVARKGGTFIEHTPSSTTEPAPKKSFLGKRIAVTAPRTSQPSHTISPPAYEQQRKVVVSS